MSILPATASFHERVEALFSALRQRGLTLSGADVDLVDAWHAQAVPFEVVARGIIRAFERKRFDAAAGDRLTLKFCRKSVEKELAVYARTSITREAASPGVPFHLERHQKLLRALKKQRGRDRIRRLIEQLQAPIDLRQAERQEQFAMAILLSTCTPVERKRIIRAAHEKSRHQADFSMRRYLFRVYRDALTREALGLKAD
jgi:hypothetical protein